MMPPVHTVNPRVHPLNRAARSRTPSHDLRQIRALPQVKEISQVPGVCRTEGQSTVERLATGIAFYIDNCAAASSPHCGPWLVKPTTANTPS